MRCGSLSNTNLSKKVLGAIFLVAAVLLVLFMSKVLL